MKNFWAKAGGTLALAFSCLASPLLAQSQDTPPPPSPAPVATSGAIDGLWLWNEGPGKNVNLVVHLRKCPESNTACMTIVWLDSLGSRKSFDGFGEFRSVEKKIGQFGDHEDFRYVTPQDVMALCGFSPPLKGTYDGGTFWQGKIEMRGRAEPLKLRYRPLELDITVTKISEDTLSVHSKKFVLGQKVHDREGKWIRVQPGDPNYPSCVKPAPAATVPAPQY